MASRGRETGVGAVGDALLGGDELAAGTGAAGGGWGCSVTRLSRFPSFL